MQTGLQHKTVFITGAATGIGRATALAFAREGARLALLDIDRSALATLEQEAAALGIEAAGFEGDLSTANGVEAAIDAALARFAAVDVLVNNVGTGAIRTFDALSDGDWLATLNLNFMSYVRTTRKLLPMLRERRGVIVNTASDLARQPEAVPLDYSASKAAILALTKGLARAEGPHVRINAVAPGPIWTPFWTKPGGFAETMGKHHHMPPQAAVEHEMKQRQLPLARLGTPEEVANVIVFLASDLASFVTSSVWGVDGGSLRGI